MKWLSGQVEHVDTTTCDGYQGLPPGEHEKNIRKLKKDFQTPSTEYSVVLWRQIRLIAVQWRFQSCQTRGAQPQYFVVPQKGRGFKLSWVGFESGGGGGLDCELGATPLLAPL